MKIAILGTRGIPKNYGGFEQNAENLALYFVKKGHDVTVYNPDYHPFKESEWKGIKIRKIFSREDKIGLFGNLLYDFLCLRDAIKREFDIILELGVPASIFYFLKNKNSVIVTNIDGLEWKRSKWNKIAKLFLKYCERQAIKKSDAIITDNPGIQKYVEIVYGFKPYYIGYGAAQEIFRSPDERYLEEFGVEKYKYYLMIGRLEPENNIEMILDGYLMSGSTEPFLVVAKYSIKYRKYLMKKYSKQKSIKFIGGIYGRDHVLNNLRYFAKIYFHGHSVGGTNPSLLEAMNAGAYIAAHDNEFNRYVLGENAFFFKTEEDVKNIILYYDDAKRELFREQNWERIKKEFNWQSVSEKYLQVFDEVFKKRR